MNVNEKKFYTKHGINVDEDAYALSIMVQWIWRSAIRDGDEIYLYIPSRRMRTLLEKWIDKWTFGNKIMFGQELDPLTGETSDCSEWYSSCMLVYIYAVRRLGYHK